MLDPFPGKCGQRALPLARAESAGEHLAVVGEDLLGHPVAAHRAARASQTGRAMALKTQRAETQNRE